jgi:hypothetical protein
MVIKTNDIKELFSLISEKKISRENAQEKAIEIRESYDNGNLEFYPKEYENEIWDAVQFIELFAEKLEENTYLYSENDLISYVREKGWDAEE